MNKIKEWFNKWKQDWLDYYEERYYPKTFECHIIEIITTNGNVFLHEAQHRYYKPKQYDTHSASYHKNTDCFTETYEKIMNLCYEYNKTLIYFGTDPNPKIQKPEYMVMKIEWKDR